MSSAMVSAVDPSELNFDVEVLRGKYRADRDKRLREDAASQYPEPMGDFSKYVDDPYLEPGFAHAAQLMLSVICSFWLFGLDWQKRTMRVSG